MKVSPVYGQAFRAVCDRALEHLEAAREAPDSVTARKAITEAYFALHDATDKLDQADAAAASNRRLFGDRHEHV